MQDSDRGKTFFRPLHPCEMPIAALGREDEPACDAILDVSGLTVFFPKGRNARPMTTVLDSVSFSVGRRETFGIVGESGAGKTMIALSVMRLHGFGLE